MTLAEILASLFPDGHDIVLDHGLLSGRGRRLQASAIVVIGVAERLPLGVEHAVRLSRPILDAVKAASGDPILVLVDSDSQRMSKRDELLGLSEFLAHLAKCLIYAGMKGHPTVGLLYGHTAAGAFIATALATRLLLALPGAEPAVMDLPSMARVTKLPLALLQEKAKSSAVFAPGIENLSLSGGVAAIWDPRISLQLQLRNALDALVRDGERDTRDRLGKARGGRPKAADIAQRVYDLAGVLA